MAKEKENITNIGLSLKTHRKNRQLTQKQVADALQINRTTYTYYELGKTEPSLENLNKLVKLFDIKYEDLLPDVKTSGIKDPRFVPRGSDLFYKIPKEEQDLLLMYRILSPEDKEKLKEYINKLSK